jgi:uncharacterized protein YndB with AHSA1/START domain
MTERSAQHGSFTIERNFAAAPAKVFAAFSTQAGKSQWFFGPPGWKELEREFDFRVGGRERLKGQFPNNGRVTDFDCLFHEIVPNQRIIYSYGMHLDGNRISVSLATIEFREAGRGTRLIVTEQGVFLDGYDDAGSREQGTRGLIEKLAAAVDGTSVG